MAFDAAESDLPPPKVQSTDDRRDIFFLVLSFFCGACTAQLKLETETHRRG